MLATPTTRTARLIAIAGAAGLAAALPACQSASRDTVQDDRTTTDAGYITANTTATPRPGTSFASVQVEPAAPNATNPYVTNVGTNVSNNFGSSNAGTNTSHTGLSSNNTSEIETGGWTFVSTVANAENNTSTGWNNTNTSGNRSFNNTTPVSQSFHTPNSPNDGGSFDVAGARRASPTDLSSRMYGDVLETNFPREAGVYEQGRNTANVRQVTFTHTGADFDPTVLRDGSRVVFASTQHRPTADIYIKNATSRIVTRLTDNPAQDVMPAVSPDGQYIAFASDRNGSWDLYLMPLDGGKPVQLTSDNTHDLHPSFSPDGQQLVFSRLGQSSGRWEMWVMDIQSPGAIQFIGYGLFPEWCPVPSTGRNGMDRIAFQRSRERGDRAFSVWTVDFDPGLGEAGHETEIINAPESALINPSWSPNGEFLVYAEVPAEPNGNTFGTTPDNTNIWMIGADGVGRVNLVSGNTIDLMPTWGADNRVYFVSDRSGVENLWTMEMNKPLQSASAQRGAIDSRSGAPSRPYANVPTAGDTQSQFED